jgi:hypothetical protein
MSREPDEFYSSEPNSVLPRPDVAWRLAKPHVIYADYLFRRICGSRSFAATFDAIILGKFEHNVFSESPSLAIRIALSVPVMVALNTHRNSDRVPESVLSRESELVYWLLHGQWFPNGGGSGDLCKTSFLFGFYPTIFAESRVLKENSEYRTSYENDVRSHASDFDYSRYLYFRIFIWRWRRFSPVCWQLS